MKIIIIANTILLKNKVGRSMLSNFSKATLIKAHGTGNRIDTDQCNGVQNPGENIKDIYMNLGVVMRF